MSDEPTTTNWLTNARLAIEDVSDPWTPMSAWMNSIQIGLRSDGVLMWRRVDKEGKSVEDADAG